MRLRIDLDIDIRQLFLSLLLLEVSFVGMDFLFYHFDFANSGREYEEDVERLLSIVREGNIPTWFASFQALAVGGVAFLIHTLSKARADGIWARGWLGIALFFIYVSLDDTARIHERLSGNVVDALSAIDGLGWMQAFPSWYWQIVFLPVFAIFGCYMLWFLYRAFAERETFLLFLVALSLYGAAVVLDLIDGFDNPYEFWVARYGVAEEAVQQFSRIIEEFLEMLGTTLILVAFLRHLRSIAAVPARAEIMPDEACMGARG